MRTTRSVVTTFRREREVVEVSQRVDAGDGACHGFGTDPEGTPSSSPADSCALLPDDWESRSFAA